MKKEFRIVRVYKEDYNKMFQKVLEMSRIEGKRVSFPEAIRRTLNIPDVPQILLNDAKFKRYRRKNVI